MMVTMMLSGETKEEGLRLIILQGSVQYTGRKDVYRVPTSTLRLLDKRRIPYQVLDARSGGKNPARIR